MARTWKLTRRIAVSYAIAVCVWLSIGLLGVLQQRVNEVNLALESGRVQAYLAFFIAVALLTPPVFYIGRRFPVTRRMKVHPAFLYLAGFPLFLLAFGCARMLVAPPWGDQFHHFIARSPSYIWKFASSQFANLLWVYLEILLTANAQEYFERARSEALERAELEQALAASELQLLKAQLHPHFLFNTLHGIATLANEDGAKASEMVLKLANLLRAVLEHSTADFASLRDELRFVAAYLDLEKMRLGSRLVVHWAIQPSVRDAQVPHLILQPLIENAVIHGVAASRTAGYIEIAAKQDGDALVMKVTNSIGSPSRAGTGLGLRNTESRLQFLYHADAELNFERKEEERIAVAAVRVPLLTVPSPQMAQAGQEV